MNPHRIPSFKGSVDTDQSFLTQSFCCGDVCSCGDDQSNRCPSIAAGASNLLVVTVDRLRQTGVNNRSNLLLIHSEAERRRCDYDVDGGGSPVLENFVATKIGEVAAANQT